MCGTGMKSTPDKNAWVKLTGKKITSYSSHPGSIKNYLTGAVPSAYYWFRLSVLW